MWRQATEIRADGLAPLATCPRAVLVFPLLWGRMIWVRHPQRGWEVPGGKVEPGESPEIAVCREAWEEAGIMFTSLERIAEYVVPDESGLKSYKWAYLGIVKDVQARPSYSEILEVRAWNPMISPTRAKRRGDVSPIMLDDVYTHLWPLILNHPLYAESTLESHR